MELEVQCYIYDDFPIILILNRINSIARIDSKFFKIYCNIVLPPTPKPS